MAMAVVVIVMLILIVNYLLSNYSHEEVMYFVKEPDYLIENSKTIFNQAKEWAKKMRPQR